MKSHIRTRLLRWTESSGRARRVHPAAGEKAPARLANTSPTMRKANMSEGEAPESSGCRVFARNATGKHPSWMLANTLTKAWKRGGSVDRGGAGSKLADGAKPSAMVCHVEPLGPPQRLLLGAPLA